MTDLIDFEVSVEGNNKNEEKDDEVSDSDLDSLKYFIDDNDEIENDWAFHKKFENITTSIDDVLKKESDKSIVDIQIIDVSNFCKTSEEEIETEIDKFKDTEKRIEKFLKKYFSSYSNWTRTQNHLVRKQTLNQLTKLAKWLSCVLSTYLHRAFDCMFLSCTVQISTQNTVQSVGQFGQMVECSFTN